MNFYRKFFSIFNRKQKVSIFLLAIGIFFVSFLEAIGISAIMPLISLMADVNFLQKYPQIAIYLPITNNKQLIIFCAIVLILFYLVKNIFSALLLKKQIYFSIDCQIYFATKLNALYIKQPYLFHLRENTAKLLSNINQHVEQIFTLMMTSLLLLFTELCSAFILWLMLVFIDPFVGVIVAGILSIIVISILRAIRKKTAMQGTILAQRYTLFTKVLQQGLGSIKETKVSCRESYFINEFDESYTLYGKAKSWFLAINQTPRFLIEAIVTCSMLLMTIIRIQMGTSTIELVPLLGVLALAAFRLMPSANRIISYANTIKYYKPSFELIYDDLIMVKENSELLTSLKNEITKKRLSFNRDIVISNLRFSYPNTSKNVLDSVSFSIPINSFVGIVGKTGAGKTTFVDILLGLFEPKAGYISVDDVNIFDDIRAWQVNLAYVPQSIYLIDGTIRENIALGIGENDIDDNQIQKVLKMSELYDFVINLPNGLKTRVGERGIMLSGGQKQRIGIARALYYEPKVLILDEATSALDNETEKNITNTLLKLKGHITIIAIAHRISTLEQCDFKVEFKDGKAKII